MAWGSSKASKAPAVQSSSGQPRPLPGTFCYSWAITCWWMGHVRKTQLDFVYWHRAQLCNFSRATGMESWQQLFHQAGCEELQARDQCFPEKAEGFLHPKFLSADLTRPRNHRPEPSVIYGLRFNLLAALQASREHLWATCVGNGASSRALLARDWVSQPRCLCLLAFCRSLNWLFVPTSCCSLLCCLGKRKECSQKRGQWQRAASEPAKHANHHLAWHRRSSASSENKDPWQTHSCGFQMRSPASESLSCPSTIQHSGNNVHGLPTEIFLVSWQQNASYSCAPSLPSPHQSCLPRP